MGLIYFVACSGPLIGSLLTAPAVTGRAATYCTDCMLLEGPLLIAPAVAGMALLIAPALSLRALFITPAVAVTVWSGRAASYCTGCFWKGPYLLHRLLLEGPLLFAPTVHRMAQFCAQVNELL